MNENPSKFSRTTLQMDLQFQEKFTANVREL